jgi:hypothetical protein
MASVRLLGAAWGTKTRSASAPTKRLRASAMGCGDALVLGWEWGQDEQTAGIEGRKQLWLQVHSYDGAGGNPNDGLAATKQDAQALPLHDGVEAANENLALVTHPGDGIEGLQDDGAGALRGAEKAGLGLIEQLHGASGPELSGRVAAQPRKQSLRICWTSLADRRDLLVEDHAYSSSSSASAPSRYLMS